MFMPYRCSRRGVLTYPPPLPSPCTVPVLFLSRNAGIAPPPPHFLDWNCVLSLHVAGHLEESITLLRLMMVVSSRLLLVLEGVGLMPVISMLDPLSTERL